MMVQIVVWVSCFLCMFYGICLSCDELLFIVFDCRFYKIGCQGIIGFDCFLFSFEVVCVYFYVVNQVVQLLMLVFFWQFVCIEGVKLFFDLYEFYVIVVIKGLFDCVVSEGVIVNVDMYVVVSVFGKMGCEFGCVDIDFEFEVLLIEMVNVFMDIVFVGLSVFIQLMVL